MKHRFINKKTGAEARVIAMYLDSDGVMQIDGYDTVEDLMDDYAAYEEHNPPEKPLIKDEKIRKAVRAWADNLQAFMCDGEITFYDDKAYRTFQTDVWKGCNIRDVAELDLVFDEDSLEDGKIYTIAELCGEEEE